MITQNTTNCPCYNCELRSPSCHSSCEEYTVWVDNRRKKQEEYKNSPENIIKDYFVSKAARRKGDYGK